MEKVSSENPGGGQATEYAVRTEHDSEVDNYGHCETRLFRGEERMRPNKVSHGAKKKFRDYLSQILVLERPAGELV